MFILIVSHISESNKVKNPGDKKFGCRSVNDLRHNKTQ